MVLICVASVATCTFFVVEINKTHAILWARSVCVCFLFLWMNWFDKNMTLLWIIRPTTKTVLDIKLLSKTTFCVRVSSVYIYSQYKTGFLPSDFFFFFLSTYLSINIYYYSHFNGLLFYSVIVCFFFFWSCRILPSPHIVLCSCNVLLSSCIFRVDKSRKIKHSAHDIKIESREPSARRIIHNQIHMANI